jgi:hypothetical protein
MTSGRQARLRQLLFSGLGCSLADATFALHYLVTDRVSTVSRQDFGNGGSCSPLG